MQFQSSRSTLNARMYLYDTPRDTMAKDLMLQSLCSTSIMEFSRAYAQYFQLYFHVFQSFMLNTNVSTHVLQSLSLNTKHLIDYVLQGPCPTQNISSIMCFRVHTQHKQHIYPYVSSTIGLCSIYKTNHHVHMQWGF